jgi:hypothetical protein
MMKFPIDGKIDFMFQTTNQYIFKYIHVIHMSYHPVTIRLPLRHQRSAVFSPCPARLGFHQQALPHGIAERGRTGAAQNLPTAQGLAFGNQAIGTCF